MLGELVAQLGANLVIRLAEVAVRGGEGFEVRDGFDVPNDHVAHMAHLTRLLSQWCTRPFALSICSWKSGD